MYEESVRLPFHVVSESRGVSRERGPGGCKRGLRALDRLAEREPQRQSVLLENTGAEFDSTHTDLSRCIASARELLRDLILNHKEDASPPGHFSFGGQQSINHALDCLAQRGRGIFPPRLIPGSNPHASKRRDGSEALFERAQPFRNQSSRTTE